VRFKLHELMFIFNSELKVFGRSENLCSFFKISSAIFNSFLDSEVILFSISSDFALT
jgi:ferredoxin-fold anticodon binding domain-containing protein